jgi:hypothetical protein
MSTKHPKGAGGPGTAGEQAPPAGTMKAVVFHGQEDVRVERIPVPPCGPEELRVRVQACAICGSDLKTYHSGNPRMKPSGMSSPGSSRPWGRRCGDSSRESAS